MKQHGVAFLLVLFLLFVSTWTASAQGPKPAATPPSEPPQSLGGDRPVETTPLRDAGGRKAFPLVPTPQSSSGVRATRQAATYGVPGQSFRYLQTFGITAQAYTTDNQHLNAPSGLFIDGSNNVYVAEDLGYRVLKFSSSGSNVLALGTAGLCYTDNYVFCTPQDIALDASGNIWIADGGNRVVEYNSSGTFQQTLPPTNSWQSGTDNTHFSWVTGIAFDNVAGRMFVSDNNNHRIQVYTFSGSTPVYDATIGVTGASGSDNSHFDHPRRLALDGSGRLYVVDTNNGRVQRCSLSGTWGCVTFTSGLNYPEGIGLDGLGNVFIADTKNSKIRKCDAGGGCTDFTMIPSWTHDVAIDSGGNVYVSDWNDKVIRKYHNSGTLLGTFAGATDVPYFVDTTRINTPWGIAVASDGSIYVAENNGQRLIKMNAAGNQQWTVGTAGVTGGWNYGDNTHFNFPQGSLAIDASGRVYVPDRWNYRIQVYNPDSSFYTTFGSYGTGNNQFGCAAGVFINPANGDIFVVDRCNQRIQVYTSGWSYKATLGTTGVAGSDGTHFRNPQGVWVDKGGNVYVADGNNHRIQKCTLSGSSGTCTTFIGQTGISGSDFDHLSNPQALAMDSAGRFYVVDQWNNRVQVFDPSGAYLTTIGGSWGTNTGQLRNPAGIAIDSSGDVYVTDTTNSRIQKYARGVPSWIQTNINGFGDRYNYYVLSLAPFNGLLYAGTFNPSSASLGAQLWRTGGSAWTSATSHGFGDSTNVGIDHLIAFNGQLYAGTWNCRTWSGTTCVATDGGQVWRSSDGSTWSQVALAGFSDGSNGEVVNFATLNNKLYASTWSYTSTHGAEIWRSPSGGGGSWTRVMSNGFNGDASASGVPAMAAFNDKLYATKGNFNGMAEVWRCTTCDGSDWSQINTSGFDGSTIYKNTIALSLAAFNGSLYAGTRNWSSGGQIWRCSTCDSGGSWSQVVGPTASVPAGFGKMTNGRVEALLVFDKMLHAVTYNSDNGSMARTGMEVWRTANGTTWEQVGFAGFGNSNNYAPYYGNSAAVFKNSLYIGAMNDANGGQVWMFLSKNVYLPLTLK